MMINIDKFILESLLCMRKNNFSSSYMLRYIYEKLKQNNKSITNINFVCLSAFRQAFGLELGQAKIILGWYGFNSEVDYATVPDAQIDQELDTLIYGAGQVPVVPSNRPKQGG